MQQAMAAAGMVGTTVVAVGMIRMTCSVVAAGQHIGCMAGHVVIKGQMARGVVARRLVIVMIVRGHCGGRVMRVQMPVMAAVSAVPVSVRGH